jgi:hypothetical protein
VIVTSDSGLTADYFAYNASGSVWNGSAYVAWADGDFATYRIAATEVGTSGRYSGTLPSDAVTFELRERGVTAALSFPRVVGETATLAAIEAKTGLIGTGAATLFQPVLTDGTIRTLLVIGDDYRTADNRAFVWTVTTSVTPTSCYLGFYKDADNQVIVEGSIVDNGATVTLTFELLAANTVGLEVGEYEYTVEMRDSNGIKITPIHSLNSNGKRYARFVERRT